jgi:hypothetical protein
MEALGRNSIQIWNSKDDFNPDSRGKSITVSQIQESVNYGEFIYLSAKGEWLSIALEEYSSFHKT